LNSWIGTHNVKLQYIFPIAFDHLSQFSINTLLLSVTRSTFSPGVSNIPKGEVNHLGVHNAYIYGVIVYKIITAIDQSVEMQSKCTYN